MPHGSHIEMKYLLHPVSFNCALFDHTDIFPLLLCFDCFLHIAQFHSHQFFQIKFLIWYLISFALIHNKSLTAPRGSITAAITWTLLNHTQSNMPGIAFKCTLRRHVRFQRWVRYGNADKQLTTRVRSLLSRGLSTHSTDKMKNDWNSSLVMSNINYFFEFK